MVPPQHPGDLNEMFEQHNIHSVAEKVKAAQDASGDPDLLGDAASDTSSNVPMAHLSPHHRLSHQPEHRTKGEPSDNHAGFVHGAEMDEDHDSGLGEYEQSSFDEEADYTIQREILNAIDESSKPTHTDQAALHVSAGRAAELTSHQISAPAQVPALGDSAVRTDAMGYPADTAGNEADEEAARRAAEEAWSQSLEDDELEARAEKEAAAARMEDDDHDDYAVPVIHHTVIFPEDGNSRIPFSPDELVDPSVVNAAIPSSRRWRFHSPLAGDDERKVTTKILNILIENNFKTDECTLTFPPGTGKDRYVQIHFKHYSDYIRAAHLRFTWNMLPIELAFSAAPLRRRHTVVKISNVLTGKNDEDTVAQIMANLSEFMEFDNIWRLDRAIQVRDSLVKTKGNSIIGLATYKRHPVAGFYRPADVPGWMKTSSGLFQIHFLERSPSCVRCREHTKKAKYHTTEECIWRQCPLCHRKGHAEVHCPGLAPPAKRCRQAMSV